MTATVTIVYAERDDALSVTNAALRFRPPPEVASALASGSSSAGPAHSSSGAPGGSGRERRARPGGSGSPGGGAPPGEGGTERRTVYVMRNGVPEAVRLTTGLSDGAVTEVVKGDLKPGDEVVTDVVISGKPAATGGGGGAPPGGAPRMGRMF